MDTLSERALCSLDDVKQYINLETDVDQDELLIRLINAASEAIYTITNREFTNADTGARRFDVSDVYANGKLYIGDFSGLTSIRVFSKPYFDADSAAIVSDALATSDIAYAATFDPDLPVFATVLYPRQPKPWESYNAVRIYGYTLSADQVIEVDATWGFPEVPQEIRQAAVVTVGIWHARDVADFGATFSVSQDRVELPRTIPPHVADSLYRYSGVGLG